MAAQWTPTVENYLGRVTKTRILEAVREAKGEAAAQLIDHLKKPEMAKEAERLLAGTGWLPEPLRLPEPEVPAGWRETRDRRREACPPFSTTRRRPRTHGRRSPVTNRGAANPRPPRFFPTRFQENHS